MSFDKITLNFSYILGLYDLCERNTDKYGKNLINMKLKNRLSINLVTINNDIKFEIEVMKSKFFFIFICLLFYQ